MALNLSVEHDDDDHAAIRRVTCRRRVLQVVADGGRSDDEFAPLVQAALAGDAAAWEQLVQRLQKVAWRSIAGFDLSSDDRKDTFAATFFRLYERLGSVREPAKLPGWVATTARNEVHTLLRSRRRDVPTDLGDEHLPVVEDEPAGGLLEGELHAALHRGLARLSASCRDLLHLLTARPAPVLRRGG